MKLIYDFSRTIYIDFLVSSLRSRIVLFLVIFFIRMFISLNEVDCSNSEINAAMIMGGAMGTFVAGIGVWNVAHHNHRTFNQTQANADRTHAATQGEGPLECRLVKLAKDLSKLRLINEKLRIKNEEQRVVNADYCARVNILELAAKNASDNDAKIKQLLARDLTRVGSDCDILRVKSDYDLINLGERTIVAPSMNPNPDKLVDSTMGVVNNNSLIASILEEVLER